MLHSLSEIRSLKCKALSLPSGDLLVNYGLRWGKVRIRLPMKD